MADENKTKEEELDQSVEESEDEDAGLAEALGLGDDEASEPKEESADEQSSEEDASAEEEASEVEDDSKESDEDADEVSEASEDASADTDSDEDDVEIEDSEVEAAFAGPAPDEDDEDDASDDEDSEVEEEEDEVSSSDDEEEEQEEDVPVPAVTSSDDDHADGLAAYFDDPHELLHAAEEARDEGFKVWDAFSPFPIHGIEDAMGIGRSWLPWVTFGAGGTGFLLANALQFGTLTFDWPMIIGGKPHAPWPSFVPIMFELTVLIGGVTSALVMFIASGCFRKPRIIDPEITNDRFVLWIDAKDPKYGQAREFMQKLDPVEIRTVNF